jgi:hypothetical protein
MIVFWELQKWEMNEPKKNEPKENASPTGEALMSAPSNRLAPVFGVPSRRRGGRRVQEAEESAVRERGGQGEDRSVGPVEEDGHGRAVAADDGQGGRVSRRAKRGHRLHRRHSSRLPSFT